jgi:hypothetical protein
MDNVKVYVENMTRFRHAIIKIGDDLMQVDMELPILSANNGLRSIYLSEIKSGYLKEVKKDNAHFKEIIERYREIMRILRIEALL